MTAQRGSTPQGYNQITSTGSAVVLGSGVTTMTAATVAAGGTGWKLGDLANVNGGTGMATQVIITGVSGTVATQVALTNLTGCYSTAPSTSGVGTTAVSPSGGSGLTLNLTPSTNTIPTNAIAALIQAEAQNLRWRDDGVAPTASIGTILTAGDTMLYTGNMAALQLIQVTSGAIINVTFQGL